MSPRSPARRGDCPAFESPMETGDGLIVRLVPADGALTASQLRGLADAARAFGNGLMEITARGGVQIRGLTPQTVAPLQDRVLALGILPRPRPAIDVSPLSGIDPTELADARPVAARIRAGAAELAGHLGPKVSVVVDGGGAIGLGGRKADVRIAAMPADGGPAWALSLGGRAPERLAAPEVVALALGALADIAASGRGARATDLPGCAVRAEATSRSPLPRAPLGRFALKSGLIAVGLGLPFGAAEARVISALAEAAEAAGAVDLRPGPERTLIATGLSATGAEELERRAIGLGCLVRADDPRAFVAACAGTPECASAHLPTRELAPQVAAALAPLLDGTVSVHLSACAKGCAHPAPSSLTLVATEGGIALVHEGTPAWAAGRPVRAASGLAQDLAALARAPRRNGETGRDLLARLGAAELWARPGDFGETIGT